MINGAGGGVRIFALQIAKLFNAEVTGVDTGDKLKMMESTGFDKIIKTTLIKTNISKVDQNKLTVIN